MSEYKKTALVLGAGGFIGSHMVKRLRSEGYWVRGVDLKYPEYGDSEANEFVQGDLRDVEFVRRAIQYKGCLLYTSPSPRDATLSRMPSSA